MRNPFRIANPLNDSALRFNDTSLEGSGSGQCLLSSCCELAGKAGHILYINDVPNECSGVHPGSKQFRRPLIRGVRPTDTPTYLGDLPPIY